MDIRVKNVIDLMRQGRAHQLRIQILARSVNLSASRLRQLFKAETGRSPAQYLKHLRIHEAEHLLASTFLSIKEVAFLIGARDFSHFVRDFKKHNGLTPSDFRAQSR